MRRIWSRAAMFVVASSAILACGCADLQYYIPAVNCDAPELPAVVIDEHNGLAEFGTAAGVSDARWLQIQRQDGSGVIGGYLSPEPTTRGSLVLLLSGAGTLHAEARVAGVLSFYRDFGKRFRDEGFRVWAPVLSEAEPYGAGEVDDVGELLEWLDNEGKTLLGVERVFVVGYSTGATTADFVNLRAECTAVVSIASLTEPDQLVRTAALYRRITGLFPCNTGLSQLRRTLDYYGQTGWDGFDVVARVAEMRSPALFMTAADDIVYLPANVRHLEQAYRDALAAGADIPELTFEYLPSGGHFGYVLDAEPFDRVFRYLERFEPE